MCTFFVGDYVQIDDKVLNYLIKYANKAFKKNEIPVSAVIVDQKGNVISYAYNNRQNTSNVIGHAEINAIIKAEKKLGDWRLNGCTMFVTLEPCNMCSSVILESRLDRVYYFLSKKEGSNSNSIIINKSLVEGYNNYKDIFNKLLTHFFDNKR